MVRATGQRTATEGKMFYLSFTALGPQKEDRAAPSRPGVGLWTRVLLWHLQKGHGVGSKGGQGASRTGPSLLDDIECWVFQGIQEPNGGLSVRV